MLRPHNRAKTASRIALSPSAEAPLMLWESLERLVVRMEGELSRASNQWVSFERILWYKDCLINYVMFSPNIPKMNLLRKPVKKEMRASKNM